MSSKFFRILSVVFTTSIREKRELFWSARMLVRIDRQLQQKGLAKVKSDLALTTDFPRKLFHKKNPSEIAFTVNRAAKASLGHRDTCLRRSLLLWWILERRGVSSRICVGVNSQNGEVSGHAWVEIEEQPINDRKGVSASYAGILGEPRRN